MAKRGDDTTASARDIIAATFDQSYREHSDLLYSMHELSRLISTHADKHMAAVGVTHMQWWALMHIFEHEGLTQTELAEIMQMGRASLGTLVERLEAKRWIERRPDPRDSRLRRVYLRHEAIPIFGHMTDEALALFKSFLAGISRPEARRLLAGVRKIRQNADAAAALQPAPKPAR
ncbi:MAG: MarR family transcriptional regulator [Hyphomicrobiales bacterium]|nr:MAG: MarR family transcriptional regulator [Hyphomicrobiales bacterium]